MEASLYRVNGHNNNLPFLSHKQKPTLSSLIPSAMEGKRLSLVSFQRHQGCAVLCAKQGSVIESHKGEELGSETKDECQDKGIVELLECLEREAITGEDQGRKPTDYNRRAKIFAESARVFQALKEGHSHTPSSHHS